MELLPNAIVISEVLKQHWELGQSPGAKLRNTDCNTQDSYLSWVIPTFLILAFVDHWLYSVGLSVCIS